MPRRNRRGLARRGPIPFAGFAGRRRPPRIGEPARKHYQRDRLSDAGLLAVYSSAYVELELGERGMRFLIGLDASSTRDVVIGVENYGDRSGVILHAHWRKGAEQ